MAKEYNISKTGGICAACQNELAAGQEFVATVRQADRELQREDFCLDCWQGRTDNRQDQLLAIWKSRVARPEQKKRLFVDDGLLIDFFKRLAEADSEVQVSFRYVLALVLMRKKLLVYDRMERRADGTEVWLMHLKGDGLTHQVIDPKLDDDKIAEVSGQLGQILEGEL